MSKRWYGNLNNRLEENKMFCDEIKIGTGMTEYLYSDRKAYEVIEVTDQKHIKVRELDHKAINSGNMDNEWELISNPENPVYDMTKRGDYWYYTVVITSDILKELESSDVRTSFNAAMFLCNNGVTAEKLKAKGKITKYHKANVSFGTADYYFDYEY